MYWTYTRLWFIKAKLADRFHWLGSIVSHFVSHVSSSSVDGDWRESTGAACDSHWCLFSGDRRVNEFGQHGVRYCTTGFACLVFCGRTEWWPPHGISPNLSRDGRFSSLRDSALEPFAVFFLGTFWERFPCRLRFRAKNPMSISVDYACAKLSFGVSRCLISMAEFFISLCGEWL